MWKVQGNQVKKEQHRAMRWHHMAEQGVTVFYCHVIWNALACGQPHFHPL